jgi:hypothetical protein
MTEALTYILQRNDLILAVFARMLVCTPDSQNRKTGGSHANCAALPCGLDSGQSHHRRSMDGILLVASPARRRCFDGKCISPRAVNCLSQRRLLEMMRSNRC